MKLKYSARFEKFFQDFQENKKQYKRKMKEKAKRKFMFLLSIYFRIFYFLIPSVYQS